MQNGLFNFEHCWSFTCLGGNQITGRCACTTGYAYSGGNCNSCDTANNYVSDDNGNCVLGCAILAGSGITATIVPVGNNVAIQCDASIGSNYVYSCDNSGALSFITACPALSDCTGGNNVVEAAINGVNYKVHIFNSAGNLSCQQLRYVDVVIIP